jgi:hypothetical protein
VSTPVNVDNFVRAETDRMFAALQAQAGGVNQLHHHREPAALDEQTVIRMNRDTLYSDAIVDISQGATLTIPDAGDRYVSVMVVNQDHYVNRVLHDAGDYSLTVEEFDTPWVIVVARVLVDPSNSGDVAAVNALQDRFAIAAKSANAFEMPDYDTESFDTTRTALLTLGHGLSGFEHAFGVKASVDPIRQLVATASAWGGLPVEEAWYVNVEPRKPVGEYELTVSDVPVDGFWSVSVYNADGFFEPNDRDAYSVNNITATPNDDGSVTIHFGGCDDDRPNCIPIMEGWNYGLRMYRPRAEILDGSWTFPGIQPV